MDDSNRTTTGTLRKPVMRLHSIKQICFLMSLLMGAFELPAIPAQSARSAHHAFAHSTQMMVVTTSGWNAVDGKLQRYQRESTHQRWQQVGAPISIVVGAHGMGWGIGLVATEDHDVRQASDPVKREGDGRSPAGVFALGTAFGFASQPFTGSRLPYLSLTPSIECVDDIRSKYYNRVVDRTTVAPDWNSSEHMLSVGNAYRWGIVVDHNGGVAQGTDSPPKPGGGSCIFLHIWSGPGGGTAGCTAMPEESLETLFTWLDPARKPLLVQLPTPEYMRLAHSWRLPPVPGSAY